MYRPQFIAARMNGTRLETRKALAVRCFSDNGQRFLCASVPPLLKAAPRKRKLLDASSRKLATITLLPA
jgi:hypothetical protein